MSKIIITIFPVLASLLILSFVTLLPESYAQDDEEEKGGYTEVRKGEELVSGIVDGKPSVRVEEKDLTYYYSPRASLADCTPTDGKIHWNAQFEESKESKVSPDLQDMIDSGEQTLCVEIVLPYYNAQIWMQIPGWEEHKQAFPDASKKSYADNTMQKNIDDMLQFLKDNNSKIKSPYKFKHYESISALIPIDLLDDLILHDNVVNIDVYGKKLWIPYYIANGWESKIGSLLQQEIDNEKINCTPDFPPVFDNCPPLLKNLDGKQILNIWFSFEDTTPMWPDGWPNGSTYPTVEQRNARFDEIREIHRVKHQPIVDLLLQNDQTLLHQRLTSDYIDADITLDFLPILEARDEVLNIDSLNGIAVSLGTVGPGSVDFNNSMKDNNTTYKYETMDIILDDDDSILINITSIHPLKTVPIPYSIKHKDIQVYVNNMPVTDYNVTEDYPPLLELISYNHVPYIPQTNTNENAVEQHIDKTIIPTQNKQKIKSLSQQIKDGIPIEDIQCKEGLILTTWNNGKISCLKESTVQILVERGLIQ